MTKKKTSKKKVVHHNIRQGKNQLELACGNQTMTAGKASSTNLKEVNCAKCLERMKLGSRLKRA